MGLAARLDNLIPDLSATLARFPVSSAVAVALCAYINIEGMGGSGESAVMAGAAAGFIASGAAHLFAEGNKWSKPAGIGLAIAAGAALALLGYFTSVFQTSLLFLFAGLIPVLMISGFLRAGVRQGALWLFNLRMGLAALLSAVVAVLFGAGLSSIVEALNFLFGAGLHGMHEHIWGTAASLIGPVYGLSLMPRDLEEEIDLNDHKDTLLERGVSILVNYIAVPMVAVYALILHAYALKIAIDGELPKGQIATMVSIFAIGGTAAWLVAWPWRESGTWLLRQFMRGWFFLTIVPAALLSIAIWRRISDYGVTPDRYGIALVAIWVAFISAYLAFRRNHADMRAILGGIAVLLLVGSVGPFGSHGLTIASQVGRFAELLAANGLLKDGKAVPAPKPIPDSAALQGNSILDALIGVDGLASLKPWFEGTEKNPFAASQDKWSLRNDIAVRLGMSQPNTYRDSVYFIANAVLEQNLIGSNRLLGPYRGLQTHNLDAQQTDMTARFDGERLIVRAGADTWKMSAVSLVAKMREGMIAGQPQPPVRIELAPGVVMVVENYSAEIGENPKLTSLDFWIIQQR